MRPVTADGERRDATTVFALLFAGVIGFLSSVFPFCLMLLTMMPPDSCESGDCEGGVQGATVVLALGLLAAVALFITTAALSRRRQRTPRWLCALATPLMPWLSLLLLFT